MAPLPLPPGHMEMVHDRRSIYLALDGVDLDFIWDTEDALLFDKLWKKGLSLWAIAEYSGRDPDEVVILAIDRARKKRIKVREGGAYGSKRK